jgi:hypothetical protein
LRGYTRVRQPYNRPVIGAMPALRRIFGALFTT